MKTIACFIASCLIYMGVTGQTAQQPLSIDTSAASEKHWGTWLNNLYESGVQMNKDSIHINEESRKIILDSNFRKLIYPPVYTWQAAVTLLKGMELKKGFWYLFNLYQADTANRKPVIETLVPFDQVMDMEKIMFSTFYTYALLDPAICQISNGKPVISRPDQVELKFAQLKEIIAYISYYRKERKTNGGH